MKESICINILRRLQAQFEMEKEAHLATKAELVASQTGASQNAMLDLELADYQRTVDSLNRFEQFGL